MKTSSHLPIATTLALAMACAVTVSDDPSHGLDVSDTGYTADDDGMEFRSFCVASCEDGSAIGGFCGGLCQAQDQMCMGEFPVLNSGFFECGGVREYCPSDACESATDDGPPDEPCDVYLECANGCEIWCEGAVGLCFSGQNMNGQYVQCDGVKDYCNDAPMDQCN